MTAHASDDEFDQLDAAMYRIRADLVDDIAGSRTMMEGVRRLYDTLAGGTFRADFAEMAAAPLTPAAFDNEFGIPERSDGRDYRSLLDETTNALLAAANDIFALAAQGKLDHYGFDEQDSLTLYRYGGSIVEITLAIRERTIRSDWAQDSMVRAEQLLSAVKNSLSTATRVRLDVVIDSLRRLHGDIQRLYDGFHHASDVPAP